jgi:hypothetical protein
VDICLPRKGGFSATHIIIYKCVQFPSGFDYFIDIHELQMQFASNTVAVSRRCGSKREDGATPSQPRYCNGYCASRFVGQKTCACGTISTPPNRWGIENPPVGWGTVCRNRRGFDLQFLESEPQWFRSTKECHPPLAEKALDAGLTPKPGNLPQQNLNTVPSARADR